MYLGLDLGTSGLKAVLIDTAGQVVDTASANLTTDSPQPLWSEQDTQQWWQAIQSVLATLGGRQDLQQIKGIGLSGHMHGAVLIDADHQVIRPCILWNDGRSAAECAELEAALPDFRERSGNVAMPGFTAPKVLWIKHHEPDAFARIHKVLLPKDYLRLLLTGRCVSEMSDAAGTLWLDPAKRDWDDDLLALFRVPKALLPEVLDCADEYGDTHADWLGAPVKVAGIAGDQHAALIGQACFEPGMAKSTYGTGCFLMLNTGDQALRSENRLLTTMAYRLNGKPCYAIEGSIFVAGAAMQWLRDGLRLITHASESAGHAETVGVDNPVYLVPAFVGDSAPARPKSTSLGTPLSSKRTLAGLRSR